MTTPRTSDNRYSPSQATFDRIKALLVGATVQGAYALGIVSATAWSQRIEPPDDFLVRARACLSQEDLTALMQELAAYLSAYLLDKASRGTG